MKTLLRIYLVVIFASSAMDAGSVNDTINSGLSSEETNFARQPSYPLNLQGMADCLNSSLKKEYKATGGAMVETILGGNTFVEIGQAKLNE